MTVEAVYGRVLHRLQKASLLRYDISLIILSLTLFGVLPTQFNALLHGSIVRLASVVSLDPTLVKVLPQVYRHLVVRFWPVTPQDLKDIKLIFNFTVVLDLLLHLMHSLFN